MGNYFAGVLDAVATPGGLDMRMRHALDAARAFGELLEAVPPDPFPVPATEDLPYSKDAIKHALLILVGLTQDPLRRERLKLGYIRLADWQPAMAEPSVGIDIANARNAGNLLAFASQLASARVPAEERRRAAALAERSVLVEELRRLGIK